MDALSVVFAAGGTGGHIFPALAIAEELRRIHPGVDTRFLASQRSIDASILNAARVPWTPIPARPFVVSPKGLASLAWNWGGAVRAARRALREPVRAAALVTTGGFVAAPAARAARAERVPIVVVNLDAVPGKASRAAAKVAAKCVTAADGDTVPPEWMRVPPIVRAQARGAHGPQAARLSFGLDPDTPTLLVTGGSQGARSINDFLRAILANDLGTLRGWQVIHQCGATPPGAAPIDRALQDAYDAADIPAAVVPFIEKMADAWAAADLAIARAGAGNVAEVWANKVPTIFLPYPYHADNHQEQNARALTSTGAAILATDLIDPDKNLEAVGPVVRFVLGSAERREEMARALAALGPADGAVKVARIVAEVFAPTFERRRTR